MNEDMADHLGLYVLSGHTPVRCISILAWAEERAKQDCRVALTEYEDGKIRVSTVFLGIDHRFGTGPPILFETMVFGGSSDGMQWRYSTWEKAEDMHWEMCARVERELCESGKSPHRTSVLASSSTKG